jgi:hypothetical protein
MQEWRTLVMSVEKGSSGSGGISSRFVYRDGGNARTFHDAVNRALELSSLTATRIREGDYPFFTIVDPTNRTLEAMKKFASTLDGLSIEGPYCDKREQGLIKNLPLAQVRNVIRLDDPYPYVRFELRSRQPFRNVMIGDQSQGWNVEINGPKALVVVVAKENRELAHRIRHAASILHVRLNPRDQLTKKWVGEPLI